MAIYLISDTHFFHKKLYEPRGFKCVQTMNEVIAQNWNNLVTDLDTVYHLGDVCLNDEGDFSFLSKLNGKKHLILGNHETPRRVRAYMDLFKSVQAYKTIDKTILSHIPVHPTQLDERFDLNIHGHLHEEVLEDKRYVNVSCEQIGYTPVRLEEIMNDR